MIAANDYVDPMLPRLSAVQLRQLIAQASGLLVYRAGADEARRVLGNVVNALPISAVREPDLRELAEAVANRHRIALSELRGQQRARTYSIPRQEFMWRAYKTGRFSLQKIGTYLDERDHSTVFHGVRAHERRMQEAKSA